MHIVDPDGAENMIRLYRSREPAKMLVEQLYFLVDPSEDFPEGWPAGSSLSTFPTFCSHVLSKVAKTRIHVYRSTLGAVSLLSGLRPTRA